MSSTPENNLNRMTPREHVRTRPGMWIGYTDERALQSLVFEVLRHAIEDAFLGACTDIQIVLHPNAEVSIIDNGRRFPTALLENEDNRLLEVTFTEPSARKRYDESGHYEFIGGMMGAGLFAVNALSTKLTVMSTVQGHQWRQSYREGIPTSEVEQIESHEQDRLNQTHIRLQPDFSILKPSEFDFNIFANKCQELASQVAGLIITLRDERSEPYREVIYYYEDGLASLVRNISSKYTPFHDPVWHRETVTIHRYPNQPILIEFACQFTAGTESHEFGFVNALSPRDGGIHLEAVRAALTAFVNSQKHFREKHFCWHDIARGLVTAISIRHPHPTFEGSLLNWLRNPELFALICGLVYEACDSYFHKRYKITDAILAKCRANRGDPIEDANDDELLPP